MLSLGGEGLSLGCIGRRLAHPALWGRGRSADILVALSHHGGGGLPAVYDTHQSFGEENIASK